MQKIVIFIEASRHGYEFPSKIADSIMNRLAIDEEAQFEILKILKVEYSHFDLFFGNLDKPEFRQKLNIDKGLDLIS